MRHHNTAFGLKTGCVTAWLWAILLCHTAHGTEGTPQLGRGVGLVSETPIHVDLTVGESVRFCSSDDGFIEPYCTNGDCSGAVDSGPVRALPAANLPTTLLIGPSAEACSNDDDCNDEFLCYRAPLQSAPEVEGVCALRFFTRSEMPQIGGTNRTPGPGFCSPAISGPNVEWHEFQVQIPGTHTIIFQGEPPSLESSGLPQNEMSPSTRYFLVDVVSTNGVRRGRLWSKDWRLTTHRRAHSIDLELYAPSAVGLWRASLKDIVPGEFSVAVSTPSEHDSARRSECLLGLGHQNQCPVYGTEKGSSGTARSLYLSNPGLSGTELGHRLLNGAATLKNTIGTNQLSPDDDGILDTVTISFEVEHSGFYEFFVKATDNVRNDEFVVSAGAVQEGEPNRVGWSRCLRSNYS